VKNLASKFENSPKMPPKLNKKSNVFGTKNLDSVHNEPKIDNIAHIMQVRN